jgi:hypothetical protein
MASIQVKCETTMPMPIEEMPFEKTKKVSPKSMGNIGQERRIKVEIIEQIEPPIDIKEEEPTGGRPQCRCLIDLSSPAKLRRDFYAWLNVWNSPHSIFKDLVGEKMFFDRRQFLYIEY